MKHGLTPNYLTHMIPNQSQDRYPLRNAKSIPLLKVQTQQYAASFLPATIRDWNSLAPETQQADTVHIFRSILQTHLRRSTLLYNVGSRRNKCYSVVFDSVVVPLIMRKNITDSPRCICNAAETCSHFLLNCPLYVTLCHHLNNIPCALTLNNLLYGDEH